MNVWIEYFSRAEYEIDTFALSEQLGAFPNAMVHRAAAANAARKNYIVRQLLSHAPDCLGIYRLTMEAHMAGYRHSSVLEIVGMLRETQTAMLIYEPLLDGAAYEGIEVETDLRRFKQRCDLIFSNRFHHDLSDVEGKVFCRDLRSD